MTLRLLFGLCAALVLIAPAQALTGDEVIAQMDEAMTRAVDQYFEYDIVTEERGRPSAKTMSIRVWIKGEKRLTEFLAPGDMKGTKALILSRMQMYIFLPAYNKVRRVASHMTAGSFMGTTFTNEDVSTVTYGPVYGGELLSETDEAWVVKGTPKEGADVNYGSVRFTICKHYIQPLEIRYYNREGVHTKTETRTDYSCEGDVCNAVLMTMTDHSSNDTSTQLIRTGWQVNTGVGDDTFSVRNLQN